jgi:hypothetical protein
MPPKEGPLQFLLGHPDKIRLTVAYAESYVLIASRHVKTIITGRCMSIGLFFAEGDSE